MISFLLCLALLIIGYFVYGKIVDNTFGPDDRETPAVRINDGVDYVVMPQWKLFLVQLLNIAGLGPIFGALQGALWGPVVFLWITFGTIFAGGVHDYFSGMMSERNEGASIAEVTGKYLGPVMQNIMRVFSVVLLIMVGTVFAVGPAGLIVTLCKNGGMSGLLKLLEGAEVEVPVGATSKNAMVPLTTINTRNILFICGGAFPNLEGIIKKRLMKKTSIGFGADLKDRFDEEENIIAQVTNEDLREYGFIPEFIGRLPMIFTLEGLTKEMLVKILKEPKNAILKQYQKLLELDEVKLEFDEGALEAIAEQALKKKTGARALRAIIEKFMLDIMYEIPKDDTIGSVTITRDYIEHKGGPLIEMRGVPALEE